MKKKILIGLGMLVSFVAGGFAGYFVRKRMEVSFEEVTEEELQEYAEKLEGMAGKGDKSKEEAQSPGVKMSEGTEDSATTVDTRKIDYTKMWKENNGAVNEAVEKAKSVYDRHSEPGEEENLEIAETIAEVTEETDEIVPSSGAEFYGGNTELTRITAIWYEEDDIVTVMDEDEDDSTLESETVVPNPNKYLGLDIREEFDNAEGTELEDMGSAFALYRKNARTDVVYQLIHQSGSYSRRKAQEEYGGTMYDNIWNH